jgi:hypothetical protein
MCDNAAIGTLTDCGEGPFDLSNMRTWSSERTVRSEILERLLTAEDWPVAAKGIRLRGVRVIGQVDLEGATLRCPLILDSCYFDANLPVRINYGAASIVALTRCHLAGLSGDGLEARSLDLSGSTFTTAVELRGANIAGRFDCQGTTFSGRDDDGNAMVADQLRVGGDARLDEGFVANGAVRLVGADIIGQFSCRGARLTGSDKNGWALVADGVTVGGGAFLDRLSAAATVRLLGADITAQISCRDARLSSRDDYGDALAADGMKVKGSVFLYGLSTTRGAIRLSGANIVGPLACTDAQLNGRDMAGNAFIADRMTVGSGASFNGRFTADGAVRLAGANITGQLVFRNARITRSDDQDDALAAYGAKVSDTVFLDGGFAAVGAVSFVSARLDGSIEFKPMALAGDGQVALDMSGARVAGGFWWAPSAPVTGRVDLEGAAFGELADDWGAERAQANGYWPTAGLLRLNGLIYDRLGGDRQASTKQRLEWIRSQYSNYISKATVLWTNGLMARPVIIARPLSTAAQGDRRFTPEPYEQLVKVYRQAGKGRDARDVAVARRADERRYGDLDAYSKAGNWFFDKTIKFGYQTWRAGAGLALVFLVFLVLSIFAQYHHAIVPTGNIVGIHPIPVANKCTPSYPCFYPLGYAIDVVIPVINVHQAEFWSLYGWQWVALGWAATVLGWAAVTLLVVGYTGLVRQQ